ncbi:MAG: hypothetical protein JXQ65_02885 [Candidatus Marinimicrobia bacterium]|nr:hypothetical protein [Candidatus Neomarinimicrobiota bacterium]
MLIINEIDSEHDNIEQDQLENEEDLKAFEERENGPTVPFDKVLEELKIKGKLK